MSQSVESSISSLINATAIMLPGADLEDHLVKRLVLDLAQDIHTYEVIGTRYGFSGEEGLLAYLRAHPKVVALVKRFKALNDSASSVNERIQLKAAHGLEDALVYTTLAMTDPTVPIAHRVDYAKLHMQLSGAGAQAAIKNGAAVGAQFNLTIMFPSGKEEKFSATVVEPAAIKTIEEDAGDDTSAPQEEDV